MRYKVALGVAEALDYLHSSAEPIIHRDVKSSNILLSDDFEPQLSDFGLSTWASSLHHMCTSNVAGTFVYLAPECFMNGKLNEKLDVYAFGVVLLELLTGRKPINDGSPKGKQSLVMWAKDILKGGKTSELQDPKLVDAYDQEQFHIMVSEHPQWEHRRPDEGTISSGSGVVRPLQLAYGTTACIFNEYLHAGESTRRECLANFCQVMVEAFGNNYLLKSSAADCQSLLDMHERVHGFPGMLGSIDCMHWEWKNCPTAC
ncbi:putative serine/threonine-protein kinase PBL5 [Salvia divinorum]|uniref:Serine/threonine-protein kinase PBL5 n=1 Tax=Salvia divinorum TaxID=28513 RepID=A0ABD1I9J2_SALDI